MDTFLKENEYGNNDNQNLRRLRGTDALRLLRAEETGLNALFTKLPLLSSRLAGAMVSSAIPIDRNLSHLINNSIQY